MKKITSLLAVLISSCILIAQTNYVTNGTFESGNTEGWIPKSWEGSMIVDVDDTDPLEGKKSMVITILTSTGNHVIGEDFWKQNIRFRMPLYKGAKYKISFKALASDPCDIVGSLDQNFAPFSQIVQNTFHIGVNSQTYEYVTDVLPNVVGHGSFTIFLGHLEAGTQIWLDDISITEVTSPLTDANICNGDFESDIANDSYYDKPMICGWSKHMDGATVNYEIDQTNPISGSKSLKITGVGTPASDGWKAQLIWMFSPVVGKKYMIEFKAKGTTNFKMAVEAWDDWTNNTRDNQLFWQEFDITNELKSYKLDNVSSTASVYDRYFLAFWFGLIPDGAQLWLDDIKFYQYETPDAVQEVQERNDIIIMNYNNGFTVSTPVTGKLNVYDVSGRQVKSFQLNEGLNFINIINGQYIIQMIHNNTIVKSSKVIVN